MRVEHLSWVFALLLAGCAAPFEPRPVDEASLSARASSKTIGDVTVSVAVLGASDARRVFGLDLASRGVQPVWVHVSNRENTSYWFFPTYLDPDYFTPNEVAWTFGVFEGSESRARLKTYLEDELMPLEVPAGSTVSGFVYTNLDAGAKAVSIGLFAFAESKSCRFTVEVPGYSPIKEVFDAASLRSHQSSIDVDLQGLRRVVEQLPCCSRKPSPREGEPKLESEPLNLVLVGDWGALSSAFVQQGWRVTAPGIWEHTDATSDQYAPASPRIFYDRPQDFTLQKTRKPGGSRLIARLWLSPYRHDGHAVWIGQLGFEIGATLEPNVDESASYVAQDLLYSQYLHKIGFVRGFSDQPISKRTRGTQSTPYVTDGLRTVLFIREPRVSIDELEILNWEFPPPESDR